MNPLVLNNPLNNPFIAPQQPIPPGTMATGGTMEGTYGAFWSAYEGAFRANVAALEAVGIAWVADLLAVILPIVTIVWAILMGSGQMTGALAFKYGWRVLFLLWMVVGGAYVDTISYIVLDAFPTELAQRLHGENVANVAMLDQFEILEASIKHFGATFGGEASGLRYPVERGLIQFSQWGAQFFLKLMFYVWVCMRILLFIAVIIGAFVIIAIPFDTTIGYVKSAFGKIVALCVWQIGSSVVLKVMVSGYMVWLDNMSRSNLPTLQHMINAMGDIMLWSLGCFVMFIFLPSATAIGSGIVMSANVVQGAIFAGIASAVSLGGRVAAGMGGATARAFGR